MQGKFGMDSGDLAQSLMYLIEDKTTQVIFMIIILINNKVSMCVTTNESSVETHVSLSDL
jgi:hypothetical protein